MSIPTTEGAREVFDDSFPFQGVPEIVRPTLVVPPSPRMSPEGGGPMGHHDQASALDSVTDIDLGRVVRGVVGTPDERVLWTLAFLAQGNPGRVARGIEMVRYDSAGAEDLRAKALKDDIAHKVLSAALDIRGTQMERNGLTLTDEAQRALVGTSFYAHRYGAMLRANAANRKSAERNLRYTLIGCAAILAAHEEIPSYREIVPLGQRLENI